MRQFFSILLLTLFFFITLTSKARADFDNGEGFKGALGSATCSQRDDCRRLELEVVTLFDHGVAVPEVVSSLPRLRRIAEDQASIWGDTILEGPYESDGKTVLDRIDGFKRGGRVVAFRIVYSENARNGRKRGRIFEASFVSPSLGSWFRDEQGLAIFSESTP